MSKLCIPNYCAPYQACGNEGGACCVSASSHGYVSGTCSEGLSCVPGSTTFGSKAMFDKLSGGFTAASRDTSVAGTCRKAACNAAYSPCGKAAGEKHQGFMTLSGQLYGS